MSEQISSRFRTAALVGPYSSGKTSLLESMLFAAGAITRKGTIKDGTCIGDSSPESRARQMSVEATPVAFDYLGERWSVLDCPGSIEFVQDTYNALMAVDIVVVVTESDPARAVMVAPVLKFLDDRSIPHIVFINKVDQPNIRLRETLDALQGISSRPLALRELPLREDDQITGFVDLASERAWRYQEGQASALIQMPDTLADDKKAARQEFLEHLADFDDSLLEVLLEDAVPPPEEIFDVLKKDVSAGQVVPVLFGSAEQNHGINRLLKTLRHDAPTVDITAARMGISTTGAPLAQIFKSVHASHTGKLSFARVWRGSFSDGDTVGSQRISGLFAASASTSFTKQSTAEAGEIVAFGRLDATKTGDFLGDTADTPVDWPEPLPPLFSLAVRAEKTADEVKLSGALTKLTEEDPSLSLVHNIETSEMVLWGQGEIHLQVALDRLRNRYNLGILSKRPRVPYKETIKKSVTERGRHKKQSGGHGQFGDVVLEIKPLPRSSGFEFIDRIVGGAVPRNYIPAVEEGARDYLKRGPLGFPVVDVSVTLLDGSYHSVDSSDQAFKTAARIGMSEGMPKCEPVLLEPILSVSVTVPSEYTSKVQRIISGRRGQILGYDAKEGWKGWDNVAAQLPQSEMDDLIIELRSLTMGVGTFSWKFDRLQEITGRPAQLVIEERKLELAD